MEGALIKECQMQRRNLPKQWKNQVWKMFLDRRVVLDWPQ